MKKKIEIPSINDFYVEVKQINKNNFPTFIDAFKHIQQIIKLLCDYFKVKSTVIDGRKTYAVSTDSLAFDEYFKILITQLFEYEEYNKFIQIKALTTRNMIKTDFGYLEFETSFLQKEFEGQMYAIKNLYDYGTFMWNETDFVDFFNEKAVKFYREKYEDELTKLTIEFKKVVEEKAKNYENTLHQNFLNSFNKTLLSQKG